MAIEDCYDPYAHPEDDYEPCSVECKRCGATGLQWENDGRQWYLITHDGRTHVCDMRSPERIKFAFTD